MAFFNSHKVPYWSKCHANRWSVPSSVLQHYSPPPGIRNSRTATARPCSESFLFELFRDLLAHGRGVRVVLLDMQPPLGVRGLLSALDSAQHGPGRVLSPSREPGVCPRPIFVSAVWNNGNHDRVYTCNCQKEKGRGICTKGPFTRTEDSPKSPFTVSPLASPGNTIARSFIVGFPHDSLDARSTLRWRFFLQSCQSSLVSRLPTLRELPCS